MLRAPGDGLGKSLRTRKSLESRSCSSMAQLPSLPSLMPRTKSPPRSCSFDVNAWREKLRSLGAADFLPEVRPEQPLMHEDNRVRLGPGGPAQLNAGGGPTKRSPEKNDRGYRRSRLSPTPATMREAIPACLSPDSMTELASVRARSCLQVRRGRTFIGFIINEFSPI
jgi:hypothetical protein